MIDYYGKKRKIKEKRKLKIDLDVFHILSFGNYWNESVRKGTGQKLKGNIQYHATS